MHRAVAQRIRRSTGLPLLGLVLAASAASGQSDPCAPDPADGGTASEATRTVDFGHDAASSVEDGQPGTPGAFEFALEGVWAAGHGAEAHLDGAAEVAFTATGSCFLQDLQLAAILPVHVLEGRAFVGDYLVAWQQRWLHRPARGLSVASLVAATLPGRSDGGAGLAGTLVLARRLGAGIGYLNVRASRADLSRATRVAWTLRAGYRADVADRSYLVVGATYRAAVPSLADRVGLELAWTWTEGPLALGPGLVLAPARAETEAPAALAVRAVWAP